MQWLFNNLPWIFIIPIATMQQFWLLTNLPRWKWTLSLKKMFCEKYSFACLYTCAQLTNVLHFHLWAGFISCVNQLNIVVKRFISCAWGQIEVFGFPTTFSCIASMFASELCKRASRGVFSSASDFAWFYEHVFHLRSSLLDYAYKKNCEVRENITTWTFIFVRGCDIFFLHIVSILIFLWLKFSKS